MTIIIAIINKESKWLSETYINEDKIDSWYEGDKFKYNIRILKNANYCKGKYSMRLGLKLDNQQFYKSIDASEFLDRVI